MRACGRAPPPSALLPISWALWHAACCTVLQGPECSASRPRAVSAHRTLPCAVPCARGADHGPVAYCARGRTSRGRLLAVSAHREKTRATRANGKVRGKQRRRELGRPLQAIHARRQMAARRRHLPQRHRTGRRRRSGVSTPLLRPYRRRLTRPRRACMQRRSEIS